MPALVPIVNGNDPEVVGLECELPRPFAMEHCVSFDVICC